MKRNTIFIIIGIIVVLVLLWWWYRIWWYRKINLDIPEVFGPRAVTTPGISEVPDDTTEAINMELEGINLGDLESEFRGIDADLQNL